MTTLSSNKICNKMAKYKVKLSDYDNINLVNIKRKAENIVLLFEVISNIIAPNVSPHQMELLEETKSSILKCYDRHIDDLK